MMSRIHGNEDSAVSLGCLTHSLSFAASPRPLPRLTTTCRSIGLIADDLHKSDKTNADVLLITRPLDVSVVLMGSVSTAGEILVEGKIRRFGDERQDGRRSGSTCNRRSRLISLSISSLSYHHGTPPSVKQLFGVSCKEMKFKFHLQEYMAAIPLKGHVMATNLLTKDMVTSMCLKGFKETLVTALV